MLLLFVLLSVASVLGAVDNTLTSKAIGSSVVEASIGKLLVSGVFPSDYGLLRRIAFVETEDGHDPLTFRAGYFGGIWQVDELSFNKTKDASHVGIPHYHETIFTTLNINWTTVGWEDLQKPLYSAIASRLTLVVIGIQIPKDTSGQAQFWKTYYTQSNKTQQQFLEAVEELESRLVCGVDADLVFVLDSSGSIGAANFEKEKQFVIDVVNKFTIAADRTRVGILTYASSITPRFHLDRYTDKENVTAAIAAIPYSGGLTYTGNAIKYALENYFVEAHGARPANSGIAKVMVVVTDGQASDDVDGPAALVHEQNIAAFAVGVGYYDEEELKIIATDPDETHVFVIDGYNDINSLIYQLQQGSCNEPAPVEVGTSIAGSVPQGGSKFFALPQSAAGVTVALSTTAGSTVGYVSLTFANPSAALYDYVLDDKTPAVFVPPPSTVLQGTSNSTSSVYLSVQGKSAGENEFVLDLSSGNNVPSEQEEESSPTGSAAIFSVASMVMVFVVSLLI